MKRFKAITKCGPFTLYRTNKGSLNISLTVLQDWPFGWEYGWREDSRGDEKPLLQVRIGKLMVAYIESWPKGFEVWFLGFWGIK